MFKLLLNDSDNNIIRKENKIIHNLNDEDDNDNSNINNNNKIEFWLFWKDLSCRFYSFLFLQLYLINYTTDNNKLKLEGDIKKLYSLVYSIDNINEKVYKKGFWYIIEKYNLDAINALNSDNGYKENYPIEHLFRLLNNNHRDFCVQTNKKNMFFMQ